MDSIEIGEPTKRYHVPMLAVLTRRIEPYLSFQP
jgi:hypothetical protein